MMLPPTMNIAAVPTTLSVFMSQGNNITWDGRNFSGEVCTAGTYFYVITVKELTFKGTVTLVR